MLEKRTIFSFWSSRSECRKPPKQHMHTTMALFSRKSEFRSKLQENSKANGSAMSADKRPKWIPAWLAGRLVRNSLVREQDRQSQTNPRFFSNTPSNDHAGPHLYKGQLIGGAMCCECYKKRCVTYATAATPATYQLWLTTAPGHQRIFKFCKSDER